MLDRIRREPAVLFALVEATVALAVAFGLDLTAEQTAAILAVVAVLTGVGVRQLVTPTAAPSLDDGHGSQADQ